MFGILYKAKFVSILHWEPSKGQKPLHNGLDTLNLSPGSAEKARYTGEQQTSPQKCQPGTIFRDFYWTQGFFAIRATSWFGILAPQNYFLVISGKSSFSAEEFAIVQHLGKRRTTARTLGVFVFARWWINFAIQLKFENQKEEKWIESIWNWVCGNWGPPREFQKVVGTQKE